MARLVGFDVGGTNARISAFDAETLEPLGVVRRENIRGLGLDAIASLMADMVKGLQGGDIAAIGVGLAAQLNKGGSRVINAPNLGWRDVDFGAALRRETKFAGPIRLINDLNALAWGERLRGAVKGLDDVLAVYVGTGVGGALICDGQLVEGAGGKAGEIGHVKVVVGGRLCGCGEKGCVEAYAGGVHLERQVANLGSYAGRDAAGIDLALVDQSSNQDPEVGELWERVTDYLAISIANAVTLTNPKVLLLGGGILENLPRFRELTLRKITPLVLAAARDDLDIRFAELGDMAGMMGAASLAAMPEGDT